MFFGNISNISIVRKKRQGLSRSCKSKINFYNLYKVEQLVLLGILRGVRWLHLEKFECIAQNSASQRGYANAV